MQIEQSRPVPATMVFNNTHQTSAAEQGPYRHGSDSVVAVEKGSENDSKVPRLTFRTFFMCILVSMGGICFGYDTGQVCSYPERKKTPPVLLMVC